MNKTIINLLERVLDNKGVQSLFQPVVALEGWEIAAYQGLIRVADNADIFSPARLLNLAERTGQADRLNDLYRTVTLSRFGRFGRELPLFFSASTSIPQSLAGDGALSACLHGVRAEMLVADIASLNAPLGDVASLKRTIDFYHQLGLRVALTMTPRSIDSDWMSLGADFLRLDRAIVRELAASLSLQVTVRELASACDERGVALIADGIRDHLEYDTLLRIGVPLGQGSFLARASREPVGGLIGPQALTRHDLRVMGDCGAQALDTLIRATDYLNGQDDVKDALCHFTSGRAPSLLPVLDEQRRVVGMLRASRVLRAALDDELDKGLSVSSLMEGGVTTLSASMTVDQAGHALQSGDLLVDEAHLLLVNDVGVFSGMLQVADLLAAVSEHQHQVARYTNPLSGLPGAVVVDEKVNDLLKSKVMFVVATIGINEIKAYNDVYGHLQGDRVILQVAQMLRELSDQEFDFIAHSSGATFTIVFKSDDWFERCESMINQVDLMARRFYEPAHQQLGGVKTMDRRGVETFHPFFSLAIGAVPVYPGKFFTHHEIFSVANEVKGRAGATYGGAIYVDQRNYRTDHGELCVRLS